MKPSIFLLLLFALLAPLRAQKPQLVLPLGHTEAITTINYLPDGKHLLSGSADKQLKLWKADGELIRSFSGHLATIREVAISPDGKHFISASINEVMIWKMDGQLLKTIPLSELTYGGRTSGKFVPVWSPDGKYLALSIKKQLNLINLDNLSMEWLPYSYTEVGELLFVSENRLYITINKSLTAIDTETGKKVSSWKLDQDDFYGPPQLFLLEDQSKIYLANPNSSIYGLDLTSGKIDKLRDAIPEETPQMITFSAMSQQVYWAKWTPSPDGKFVFRTTHLTTELFKVENDGLVYVRDLPLTASYQSENIYSDDYKGGFAHPLQFSADNRYVLWRTRLNEQALVYDLQENQVLTEFTSIGTPSYFFGPGNFLPHSYPSVAFSPTTAEVAVGKQDGRLLILDIEGKVKPLFKPKKFHRIEWVNVDTTDNLSLQAQLNLGDTDAFFDRQSDSLSRDLLDWRDLRDSSSLLRIVNMNLTDSRLALTGQRKAEHTRNEGIILPETRRNYDASPAGIEVAGVEDYGLVLQLDNPNPGAYLTPDAGKVFLSGNMNFGFESSESVTDVGLSPDLQHLIVSNTTSAAKVWDLACLEKAAKATTGEPDIKPCIVSRVANSPRSLVHGISSQRGEGLLSCGPLLYRANLKTGKTDTLKGHRLDVIGATFFKGDRFIVSWAEDHSLMIWNASDSSPLLTLFFLNESDWIATTPSGLFDASPGAMNALYYSIGFELLDVNQLKERYYEPGLLQKLLGYSNESIRPVEGFDEVDLFPEIIANIDKGSLHIELRERNGGIGKTSVFINGKEVIEEANPLPETKGGERPVKMDIPLETYRRYFISHPDSTNVISIRAYNEEGWLKSKAFQLSYRPPSSKGTSGNRTGSTDFVGQYRPKMYAITIGTRDYKGEDLDLAYPDKDALAMSIAIKETASALFNDRNGSTTGDSLEVHCLSTSPLDAEELQGRGISWNLSSKTNIEKVFRDIGSRAKAEDVILVYFSGHGMAYGTADQAQFYYLTRDVANGNLSDNAVRQQFAISTNEITDWLNTIPALKQVLIVDACNSGTLVDEVTTGGTKDLNSDQLRALERMKDRTGMFVISGSASDKVSYEASEYGQGLLTYALLQGIIASGGGTRKYIDVMTLLQYATDEVPRLAATINGIQTPRLGIPANAASFDIGIADQALDIPISKVKPVMIRSTFLNGSSYRDDYQLATLLETEFRKESEKGYKADLLYVNTSVYPGAYSTSGIYEVSDNGTITLSAKLFKDEELIKDLEIPAIDSAKKLVKYLKRAVEKALVD